MSRDFPDQVNPWKAAEGQKMFTGTLPMARMSRLCKVLEEGVGDPDAGGLHGEAGFEACFRKDSEGWPVIELEVHADLPLICQRSLNPFGYELRRETELVVIEDPAEQQLVPDHYETTMADDGMVRFSDLVEDELLIGLPTYPYDPKGEVVEYSTGGVAGGKGLASDIEESGNDGPSQKEGDRTRPFAGLKELLKGRAE